jgi:hypothetical protein
MAVEAFGPLVGYELANTRTVAHCALLRDSTEPHFAGVSIILPAMPWRYRGQLRCCCTAHAASCFVPATD